MNRFTALALSLPCVLGLPVAATSVLRLLPGLSVRPEAFDANSGYIHLFMTDVEPGSGLRTLMATWR
jgi:hypothetical protein